MVEYWKSYDSQNFSKEKENFFNESKSIDNDFESNRKSELNRRIYFNFINALVEGYDRNVSYHNDLHALDVFQTSYAIVKQGKIQEKLRLEDYDQLALYLSCLCHDFKHPGLNNTYHFNAQTDLALTYNGKILIQIQAYLKIFIYLKVLSYLKNQNAMYLII